MGFFNQKEGGVNLGRRKPRCWRERYTGAPRENDVCNSDDGELGFLKHFHNKISRHFCLQSFSIFMFL